MHINRAHLVSDDVRDIVHTVWHLCLAGAHGVRGHDARGAPDELVERREAHVRPQDAHDREDGQVVPLAKRVDLRGAVN